MGKHKFRITERDFLVANRKAAREEEIREHGKQIIFRSALKGQERPIVGRTLRRQVSAMMTCLFAHEANI